MSDHSGLIARLEASKEGSRGLGAAVLNALGHQAINRGVVIGWEYRPDGVGLWKRMPDPTTSIDSIMALIEQKHPGHETTLVSEARSAVGKAHDLHIRRWKADVDGSYAQALALALCIALLRALSTGESET